MADKEEPELATKAPESDADTSQSLVPGDTPAQTGAAMGEHCVTDRPTQRLASQSQIILTRTAAGSSSSGEITKLGDIDVYITKPADYPHSPSKLLLMLSSGTGIHSVNNQLQADAFAANGFLVIMPDQFNKDPAPNSSDVNAAREQQPSLIEQFKLHAAEAALSFMIDMWLARQTPEKVIPILNKVIDAAKEEFADAIASGGGIYAIGYCFGGKYVLELASELPDTVAQGQAIKDEEAGMAKRAPLIKAGALAHGTQITSQDFADVKSPICIVAVENDQLFPDEHRESGVQKLTENGVLHEVKVYPGVPHGFAVVGEYTDEAIKTAQKEAFEKMLAFLKSH